MAMMLCFGEGASCKFWQVVCSVVYQLEASVRIAHGAELLPVFSSQIQESSSSAQQMVLQFGSAGVGASAWQGPSFREQLLGSTWRHLSAFKTIVPPKHV